MRILRRIKGVTLRDKVKGVDLRKELGETTLVWTHAKNGRKQ